jgi:hypothetical protein
MSIVCTAPLPHKLVKVEPYVVKPVKPIWKNVCSISCRPYPGTHFLYMNFFSQTCLDLSGSNPLLRLG